MRGRRTPAIAFPPAASSVRSRPGHGPTRRDFGPGAGDSATGGAAADRHSANCRGAASSRAGESRPLPTAPAAGILIRWQPWCVGPSCRRRRPRRRARAAANDRSRGRPPIGFCPYPQIPSWASKIRQRRAAGPRWAGSRGPAWCGSATGYCASASDSKKSRVRFLTTRRSSGRGARRRGSAARWGR